MGNAGPFSKDPVTPPEPARSILITRPEPGASETAERVTELGLIPILAPVLEIRATAASLPDPGGIAALLITSGNAISPLPAAFHATPVFCVGDTTAARAQSAGFRHVFSAAGDAESLARLVVARRSAADAALLFATGRGQGTALVALLRAAGFRVIRRVVYAAVPAPALPQNAIAALRAGDVHAALFFSAETARQFVRLVRRAGLAETTRGVDAISIGQPAAVALGVLPWRRIRVAARPNQDDMLALLR